MSALRELLATFGFEVDTSALDAADGATNNVVEGLKDLGKGVIAAFAVEKVFDFSRELLEQADVLAKQSEALGISTEELQGWEHAAQLSGSSAEEFTAAFTKFTRNVNEASESAAGPAAQAFKTLGVSIKDSTGKLGAPIDLLDGVVAGLQNIQDPAKRTAVVMDLFGKSGAKLLPLLSEGPEGIAKLRGEVAELGGVFDDAFLENAQEVNDNVDRLKLGLRGFAIQVIGPLLPDLVKLSQYLISGAKSFIAIIKQTHVARSAVTALAVASIPALIAGLGTLGAIVWQVVLPFLALDDALTFLAGGDSLIGRGLEKAFGKGTAEAVRKWCTDAEASIKGPFIGALDLLRIAFSDTDAASQKLWQKFELDTRGVERAIDAIVDKIKLIAGAFTDLDTLQQGANDFLDLITSPFDTEEDKAQKAKRHDERFAKEHPLAPAAPEVPNTPEQEALAGAYDLVANSAARKGPPAALAAVPSAAPAVPDYAAMFKPTMATATAPLAAANVVNDNKTIAPQTHVHVTVEGGSSPEETGNRVGKAGAKAAAPANLRAVKAALVPTPG